MNNNNGGQTTSVQIYAENDNILPLDSTITYPTSGGGMYSQPYTLSLFVNRPDTIQFQLRFRETNGSNEGGGYHSSGMGLQGFYITNLGRSAAYREYHRLKAEKRLRNPTSQEIILP